MTRIRQGPAIVCIERYARPHQYSHFHNTIDSSSLKNKTRLEQNTIISQKSQDEKKNWKNNCRKQIARIHSSSLIASSSSAWVEKEIGDDVTIIRTFGRLTIDSPLSLSICRMLADAWRLILRSRCRLAVCSRTPDDWFSALVVDLPYARGGLQRRMHRRNPGTGPNAGFTQTLAARPEESEWTRTHHRRTSYWMNVTGWMLRIGEGFTLRPVCFFGAENLVDWEK
jgi:hypothetical protein